ncbi:hypothetical protein CDIK_0904 [Cucumispora dikerogammari]|nr:hypothetical protein CDIK_0904 [Cucumispora dikerogammari]
MNKETFDDLPSDSSDSVFSPLLPLNSLSTLNNIETAKEKQKSLYTKIFGSQFINASTSDSERELKDKTKDKLWEDSSSSVENPDWVNKQTKLYPIYKKKSSYKLQNSVKILEANFTIKTLTDYNNRIVLLSSRSFSVNNKEYKTDFTISDCLSLDSFLLFTNPYTQKLFQWRESSDTDPTNMNIKIINKPLNEKGLKKISKISINNKLHVVVLGEALHILTNDIFDVLLSIKLPCLSDFCINHTTNTIFLLTKDAVYELNFYYNSIELKYESKLITSNLFGSRTIFFNYGFLIIVLKNSIKLFKQNVLVKTLLLKKKQKHTTNNKNRNNIASYSYDYLIFMSINNNLRTIDLRNQVFVDWKPVKSSSVVGINNKLYLGVKKSVFAYDIL